jgi:hypothetical protein
MSESKLTSAEIASVIAGLVLKFSAKATQQIGEQLLPRKAFLKRVLSRESRETERDEVLKLNCDVVIPHLSVAEYSLEHGDYWERDNSDIAGSVRTLCFQAIGQAFENAGCSVIDADRFVREKTERFVVYAATALISNIAEEVLNDHELPSRVAARELLGYLGPARIASYKELWARDDARLLQPGFVAELPQKVYEHLRGEAPREWDVLQFNMILDGSLAALNLETEKFCWSIEVS